MPYTHVDRGQVSPASRQMQTQTRGSGKYSARGPPRTPSPTNDADGQGVSGQQPGPQRSRPAGTGNGPPSPSAQRRANRDRTDRRGWSRGAKVANRHLRGRRRPMRALGFRPPDLTSQGEQGTPGPHAEPGAALARRRIPRTSASSVAAGRRCRPRRQQP